MSGKEVTDFVIIPPSEQLAEVQAAKMRIVAALMDRFPGFRFGFATNRPFGDQDEFAVLPIMGAVGDGEASEMCEEPPPGLVDEMKAICEGVDLSTGQYLM